MNNVHTFCTRGQRDQYVGAWNSVSLSESNKRVVLVQAIAL